MTSPIDFTWQGLSRSLAIGALACSTVACGDDDGGSGLPAGCPDLSRIALVSFQRAGNALEWKLQVAGMPPSLTLNQVALAENVLEYRWGVELDADKDGETDVSVTVSHFKSGLERTVTDVLGSMSRAVWEHTGPLSSTVDTPDVTLQGSTFTFRTEDDMADDLALITERSQVRWVTSYRNGRLICEDERR